MLLINYIFAISPALAFTDYFPDTIAVFKKFGNNNKIKEVPDIKNTEKITKEDEIQVISLAVHGKRIEFETEEFSKNLFDKVVCTRKKSALYSFLSNITTEESGNYYNGRCTPTQCCKKIDYTTKNGKNDIKENKENYGNGTTCQNFKVEKKFVGKLTEKEVCKFKEVCYLNAGHVTSENFTTNKLNELLPERYPVSFHGFKDKNDTKGSPVEVVLGGLSNQKYKLAELYHNITNGAIRIAICRSGNNCKVYDPNNEDFDTRTPIYASGLSGSSKDNFVNFGKYKCGLQLELSTTFRKINGGKSKHGKSLVESIFNTLPNRGEKVCDDESLYDKAYIDTDDESP